MLLDLMFYVYVCRSLFVLFLLAIVLSVRLRYTDSDYPFGIFNLFEIVINIKFGLMLEEVVCKSCNSSF